MDQRRSGRAEEGPIENLLHHPAEEIQRQVAAHPQLNEDLALAFLARRDLARAAIEDLTKNAAVMKSRKVIGAIVMHPRAPRHVSLPIIRHLYTFELMHVALTPQVPADIKMAAEEAIVGRLETVSSGERLSLARRCSTRVAAALLLDKESRVIEAALNNPHLTEAWVVRALMDDDAPQAFVEMTCRHQKWSLRQEVRVALVRNTKTPFARALQFAQALPTATLRDVLRQSRLEANIKMYLLQELENRTRK